MPPPFLLYLLSDYYQTWYDSTMAQNLSKSIIVKSKLKSLRRIYRDLYFVEYQKWLKTAYLQMGATSSSFIQFYSNLVQPFNTSIDLRQKVGFKIIVVSLVLMTSST